MKKLIINIWNIEAIRYLFAGGIAFVTDKAAFFLFNTFLLPDLGHWGVLGSITNMISVLCGFIFGTLVNNALSMTIVFTNAVQQQNKGVKTNIAFFAIAVIGLAASVGGNQACIAIWGRGPMLELLYNIGVAIPVFVWNYLGRRLCITRRRSAT